MKTNRLMCLAAGLTLSLAVTPRAQAWQNSGITWNDDAATAIATISFPAGSVWRNDLLVELAQWNDMLGMHFEFDPLGDDTDGTYGLGNGANEIAFTDNAGAGGNLGLTSIRFRGSDIEEADTVFNNTLTWETGAHDPRAVETTVSFRFTSVHELGHFLGLDHEDNQMAVLLSTASGFFGGSENTRARGFPDDAIGARTLYPFTANHETDIAISNFRWVASDSTGLILPTGTTTVRPGGTFTTGFAFGNLGTETVTDFEVIIVMSSNNIISTADRTIATGTGWGTAGFYGAFTFAFAVPGDMPPGEYFVGAILDPNNRILEQREANNRMAFPGQIRVR
jgi:hypothetical protein